VAGVLFFTFQHSKSRHFHSSTAKLVPGGTKQLLSLAHCCDWPFRPKYGNNKFKVSNDVADLITYSKCRDLCCFFFIGGEILAVGWFPERPIDGVDEKSGPVSFSLR
jgi:hypothetical protein